MDLRPTNRDENPSEHLPRIFNGLQGAFDRVAAFSGGGMLAAKLLCEAANPARAGGNERPSIGRTSAIDSAIIKRLR